MRTLLGLLERKGHLRHEADGPRYVFLPTVARQKARTAALRQLVQTFFGGSPEEAAATLLDAGELSGDALDRLERRIEAARRARPDNPKAREKKERS